MNVSSGTDTPDPGKWSQSNKISAKINEDHTIFAQVQKHRMPTMHKKLNRQEQIVNCDDNLHKLVKKQ